MCNISIVDPHRLSDTIARMKTDGRYSGKGSVSHISRAVSGGLGANGLKVLGTKCRRVAMQKCYSV